MPWLRLDADIFENPKLFGAPHGEQGLFIRILCAMKSSSERCSLSASYWDPCYWAKRCNVDRSDAEDWITDLERRGLIEHDGERMAIHKWREYQPDPTAAERQEAKREREKSETNSHASHGDICDSRDVTHVTLTGQDRTLHNKTEDPPYIPPKGDALPQVGPLQPKKKRRTVKAVILSDDFLAFWAAYPRQVGQLKAWDAWEVAALKGVRPSLEIIISAIERQKRSPQWMKDDGQFIPLPTTWLNQGRWADKNTTVVDELAEWARQGEHDGE